MTAVDFPLPSTVGLLFSFLYDMLEDEDSMTDCLLKGYINHINC
jgi:hypothetical protein